MRRPLLCLTLLLASCSPRATVTDLATHQPIELGPTSTVAKATPTRTRAPSTPTPLPITAPVADWSRGPEDAPVTIVVYADFQ